MQNDDGKVTDFISYYTLPSSIMHHPVHKKLKAAYAFYNVSTKANMVDLMQTALTLAKQVRTSIAEIRRKVWFRLPANAK